ncbi:HTATIP2 [Mytilus coruscus]|uniref:Protein HTATIP2 n=1 Tax=Mytilus coruscus TaxID=42192 RepID=A0A6J8CPA6_MYTCO|nr:HTATIP2 [Mytilus coruscus]
MQILWFKCNEIIPGVLIALIAIILALSGFLVSREIQPLNDTDYLCNMASNSETKLEEFKQEDHTAFVLGYTGEVGKELLKELKRTRPFKKIVLIGRRIIDLDPDFGPEFEQKKVDFDNITDYKEVFDGIDTGFCCLGTTRGKSGSEGFVKVDHDYILNSAEVAKEKGCKHFTLVSSQGADKNANLLYTRIKGQVEEELKVMHFDRLSVFRPGVLMCDREESRPGEAFFRTVLKPFSYFFPTAITTPTDVVAKAMVRVAVSKTENTTELFENKAIHALAGNVKCKVKKKSTNTDADQDL